MKRKQIPPEAIISLRQRLDELPPRSPARGILMKETASVYGVSVDTLYRALRERRKPKSVHRSDRGKLRRLTNTEMERYCEVIAAMKIGSLNKKGHHLSTIRAIEILEKYGMETPGGFVQLPPRLLKKSTVNHYLKAWGYDLDSLRQPSPAVRFQATQSNECWQFDLSPSDLKYLTHPSWIEPGRGKPQLMLYSVVDDRSGVCYQEYRCVYGEDVEAALRFLFNAMSSKKIEGFNFQGIPQMIYLDNGPIAKSRVFLQVMEYLGVKVMTHLPQSKDPRKTTARAKGKVERAFRTVKEAHETLYHFHEPETETEANAWLHQYLIHYNNQPHRREPHSRFEDWLLNLAKGGIRQMCSWERFCTFAREPEQRKVGVDARVSVEGVAYEVDPNLAGEKVTLWWGLFDHELYIDHQGQQRQLRELIGKRKKPVALFIDEAHDLYSSTLTGLKRLIEVVEDGGGTLSVLLVGHPKLRNDLRRPTMEEIGYRTAIFSVDGLIGSQTEYIQWLLSKCLAPGSKWQEVITPEAVNLLGEKLRTPLQIQQHLSLAFEEAYHTGEKPVSEALVDSILSKQIDDLEPTLTRHGYSIKSLAEQFNTRPAEIRSLFKGQLDAVRAQDLREEMLAAGLPI